jgi:hypothetical protein
MNVICAVLTVLCRTPDMEVYMDEVMSLKCLISIFAKNNGMNIGR